jgi:hypothetical protein
MRVELPRRPRRPGTLLSIVMSLAVLLSGSQGVARAEESLPAADMTLIVYTHHSMHDSEWAALSAALHRGLTDSGRETSLLPRSVDLVPGEAVIPGIEVNQEIVVHLEGDCTLVPRPRTTPSRPLGWVNRLHGRIEPFIHVDCNEIVQMLGPIALGMDQKRRDTVMGEAITRVILHEWIHIATQNSGHKENGVTKSAFDIRDLLADDVKFAGKSQQHTHKKTAHATASGE